MKNELLSVVALGCLAACAARSSPVPVKPVPARMRELVFAPSGAAAEKYGSAVANQRTDLGDAILAAIDAAGGRVPAWSDSLAAAAAEVATAIPEDDYAFIEFALHHHGIVEPTPHLYAIVSNRRDDKSLAEAVAGPVAELLARHDYRRIGVGLDRRQGRERAVVVALLESYLDLEPVPRHVGAKGRVKLRGRLLAPFGAPAVLTTRETGAVEEIDVREKSGRFSATVPCRGGVMRIEISGVSKAGSAVLANFPVYCGREPPTVLRTETSVADLSDIGALEQRIVDLANQERRRAGLAPLDVDREVAAVARAYSREMARTGQVVHVSPVSGAADDRLRNAGVVRPLVQENLARARSPEEAHRNLMNSPGHRANILSDIATHIGVGMVAVDSGDLLVTQLFTRIPPPVDVISARELLVHRAHAVLGVRVDPVLQRIAQSHAERMAAAGGGRAEDIRDSDEIQSLSKYRGVRVMVAAVADANRFGADKLPRGGGATHVGIGIGQGRHETLGEGAIYIVVLLGVAR